MEEKEKPKKKRKKEGEHKKPWQEVYASVEEIQHFLGGRVMLRHNVISGRVECRLLSRDPWEKYDGSTEGAMQLLQAVAEEERKPAADTAGPAEWQPISDRIVNSLWVECSQTKPVRIQDMYRVIESDFTPDYHPFRYYLEHLPPWDGQNHILALSTSVTVRGGVEQQMLFYEYLRRWLVGMVAGWVDTVAVNHVILVLIGEQGSYKTTWFN